MSRSYTAPVPVEITCCNSSIELIADVRFTHIPAYRGRGPSYSDGGLPPEPACAEDVEVIAIRDDKGQLLTPPLWLREWIAEHIDEQELFEAVPDGPDPDDARDRAFDDELQARR